MNRTKSRNSGCLFPKLEQELDCNGQYIHLYLMPNDEPVSCINHDYGKHKYNLIIKYTIQEYHIVIQGSDIESFIFGGFSSRFWAMRKKINLSNNNFVLDDNQLCWNFISIKLRSTGLFVDLVINNQKHMNILIHYLLMQIDFNSLKK